MDIAERLNLWFIKQPLELLRNLPSHSSSRARLKHIRDLRADRVNKPQFTIPHITLKNIEELVKLMPSHKAAGSDGLGARILKTAAPAISVPLSRLITTALILAPSRLHGKLPKLHLYTRGKETKTTRIIIAQSQHSHYYQKFLRNMFTKPCTATCT